ncbi:AAA family ATPase [Porphyromonas loveana]|uniref:AAA domain-containing protein n=1 Tax=Porphyromonas loveana TaxID=1884669 RepID=A0A2U1FPI2_9PORP|nr:AAA family ATPase [Porphyromonas loveana]PVZ14087.1 hypothetical protein C7382_102131 [Porphyromonas loveana]
MNNFFKIYDNLLRNLSPSLRRGLMDEINWEERLIGIKGSRGVGKTTFLLDYAREKFGVGNRKCLYINLNQLYFTTESLVDFAGDFVEQGGEVLLLDQVYKYPDWPASLRKCIELYPSLRIVFTGSTVMRLKEENPELNGLVTSYVLDGFSFREFLNLRTGLSLKPYTWEEIVKHHEEIVPKILDEVNPLDWLQEYLHHGYYPIFLEDKNYSENLLKTLNMTLEVDVLFIRQIEQRFLHKLRKLLYILGQRAPGSLNISNIAKEVDTSRTTITNYLKYLSEARLIKELHRKETEEVKKPAMIYLDNTNVGYVIQPEPLNFIDVLKTFFLNQVKSRNEVCLGSRSQIAFCVNGEYQFCIDEKMSRRYRPDRYYAVHNIRSGTRNIIPLWLFGFLY